MVSEDLHFWWHLGDKEWLPTQRLERIPRTNILRWEQASLE